MPRQDKQHSLRVVVAAAAMSIVVLTGAASEAVCAGFRFPSCYTAHESCRPEGGCTLRMTRTDDQTMQ